LFYCSCDLVQLPEAARAEKLFFVATHGENKKYFTCRVRFFKDYIRMKFPAIPQNGDGGDELKLARQPLFAKIPNTK
jgi:hypothetical protein